MLAVIFGSIVVVVVVDVVDPYQSISVLVAFPSPSPWSCQGLAHWPAPRSPSRNKKCCSEFLEELKQIFGFKFWP